MIVAHPAGARPSSGLLTETNRELFSPITPS